MFPFKSNHDPSRWSKRAFCIGLATLGCMVASYLGLYQLGVLPRVWEPFFGDGSVSVLHSALSRMFPVPDAVLGATAYFLEIVFGAAGGRDRWRTAPWIVAVYGLLAGSLGVVAIVLVVYQAFFVNAWCTLCLTSAAISITIAVSAAPEVAAAWQRVS